MKKAGFKNDKYKQSRGGYSRLLSISCEKCGEQICRYQKDGPGNLRRMYVDRISDPNISLKRKDLSCSKGHLLGTAMTYEKNGENRPAYRLYVDAVIKKIVKA